VIRRAFYMLVFGLVVGVAVKAVPDIARYLKIRSM
jgi:hypothetical protein